MNKNTGIILISVLAAIAVCGSGCTEKEVPAEAADVPDTSAEIAAEGGLTEDASQPGATATAPVMPGLNKPAGTNVVVSVEDNDLTANELQMIVNRRMSSKRLSGLQPQMRQQYAERLEQRVIQSFVDRNVMMEAAQQKDIVVEEGEIDEVVEQVKGTVPEDVNFDQALAQMGMTEPELREEIKREIMVQKLVENKLETLPEVGEDQAQAFYEDRKEQFTRKDSAEVRHILVKVEEGADKETLEAKKAEAERLRKKLKEGAEFAELAKAHSDCGSARSGGNLGLIEKGRTVPAFEKAAFSQETGKIGPVVKSKYGYHIIEVLNKNEAGTLAFEEVKEDIINHLGRSQKQEAISAYIEELKSGMDIDYPGGKPQPATPMMPMQSVPAN